MGSVTTNIHCVRMGGLEDFNRDVEESFAAGVRGISRTAETAFDGIVWVLANLVLPIVHSPCWHP